SIMQTRAPNLRTVRLAYLPLALFVVVAMLAACGDDGDDGEGSPNGDNSLTEEVGTPTVGAPPTGELLESLPADYPETFQLYPDAKVTDTARFADQVRVTLATSDSRDAVASFYRLVVRTEPWQPLAETEDAGRGLLVIRFQHVDDPVRGQVTIITTLQEPDEPIEVSLQFTVPEIVGEPLPTASPIGRSQSSPTGD
ncbi:MAG: hypothetical protein IIA90_08305, partial [Chloroflexi bacterium]|nr:hypothetical protein [Chloroflexota bacterium]